MRKQRILAILLAGLLAFSSCEELPLPAEEIETGAVGIRNTTSKAEPASEEEPQREFCLPEVIELGPGESLALDLPSDAAIESGDETVVSAASAVLTAGEKGETTLSVTLDGTTKEAAVRVVAFEDPEETIPEELPKGKYLLVVNKKRNYVVVYDLKDEAREHPLKAMICSTGEATPDKTYKIGYHKVWNRLYGNVWGKYATVIRGDILFHSVPFAKKDSSTLIGKCYNDLGTSASMGCVRLRVCDSKWIHDCCESGTTVTFVTDDVESPIPYDLPLELPDELTWDPTDPEEGNPWLEKAPRIEAENHVLAKGTAFDPADYIRIYDIAGNDVTKEAALSGEVDTSRTGRYLIHIFYEDVLHHRVSQTVSFTVLEGKNA